MSTKVAGFVERGFVDLPCEISSHRRWPGEYLVFVHIPGELQPRQLFVNESHVSVREGSPTKETGARGVLRAPVAPEASRLAGENIVVVGLPGDPLAGGHWVSLDSETLDRLK